MGPQLWGGAGRDTIDGGIGGDSLYGGAGSDTIFVLINNEPQPYLNRICCSTQGGCCSAHGTGGAPRCPRG
ncbi:MAG: hypothetical protein KBG75_07600, partial [Pseudomonadales bacterium]|nr:hypothetical protein [Pseudomonadales bacterium]